VVILSRYFVKCQRNTLAFNSALTTPVITRESG
jgi:hypothetical protein